MEILHLRYGSLIGFAAFVVAVAGIKAAAVLVVPFLLAAFLAIICAPPLFWMQRKGIPSMAGILILMLGVIAVQVLLVTLVSSSIAFGVSPGFKGRSRTPKPTCTTRNCQVSWLAHVSS